MKAFRVIVGLTIVATIYLAIVATRRSLSSRSNSAQQQQIAKPSLPPADSQPASLESEPASKVVSPARHIASAPPPEPVSFSTDKLERLAQIREMFHSLAAGDRLTAIRAVKQFTDEVERETAMLTLVTEWRHGELDSPRLRAQWINTYGLEVGLGFEIANQSDLGLMWANELTTGPGRTDLLAAVARGMTGSDPTAAFALNDQVPEGDRKRFFDTVLGNWASRDTAAAMQWAEQLPDPAGRDAAMQTIRAVAPTGIGALMTMQDGHPVFQQLVPGTPAALSGQLSPGDRLIAIAQGNNQFVDVKDIALANLIQLIRGEPGTLVQLQVLSADAPPNSPPRTINLYRDQIKFKN